MPKQCCIDFWYRIKGYVPVFTLVGYDLLSAETVNFWIEKAREKGVNADKIERAKQHLDDILAYQKKYPEECKIPD